MTAARTPQPRQPEVVECAEVWVSELWFVNRTRHRIHVYCRRGDVTVHLRLAPGDSAKTGVQLGAQHFADPAPGYHFVAHRARKPRQPLAFLPEGRPWADAGRTLRRYFRSVVPAL